MIFRKRELPAVEVVGLIEGTRTRHDIEFEEETRKGDLVEGFLHMAFIASITLAPMILLLAQIAGHNG